MQVAENLHEKLWGLDLDNQLVKVTEDGNTWKYLPKVFLNTLQLPSLGYHEDVLLFQEEYGAAIKTFDLEEARTESYHGAVVTGQPGAGMVLLSFSVLLIITASQENHLFSIIYCFSV